MTFPAVPLVVVLAGAAGVAAAVVAALLATRRHKASVEASEARFRLLVDGVQDYALYMVDLDGRVTAWNSGAERIFGYAADEVLGGPMARFYVEAEAAAGQPARDLAAAAEQGRHAAEGWRCRKDGTRFWADVTTRPLRDDSGRLVGFARVVRDLTERRAAEEALRESEARFAGIIGSAMDAIISIDEAQRITLFNRAAEEMFRCRAADVIGRPLDILIPERFQAPHRRHVREFGETGVTSRSMRSPGLLAARRLDGEEFPIEATISQITVGGQRLYSVILRDVSARQQAEEALRRSEARLAGIIGSAMDAIISVNAEQRIVLFNRAAEEMFRIPVREAIGQPLERFIPERLRARHRELMRAFGESGLTSRPMGEPGDDLVALTADGVEFPIEASISQVEVAGRRLFTVIIRNIADRKRAEAALAEQAEMLARMGQEAQAREAYIRSVVESLRDGLVVLDQEGRVAVWNAAMARQSGCAAASAIGRHYRELAVHLGGASSLAAIGRLLEGAEEEVVLAAVEQRGPDGGRAVRNIRGSLLRQNGAPAGAVLLVEDITERLALEQMARQADKLQVLGTLSAGVAHEINNPIGIITSRIELMLEDAERLGLPPELRDDLGVLRRNADRVARIARSLLSFARQAPGHKAPINLNAVVEEVLVLVGKQAANEQIAIEKRLAPDLPTIEADANQLTQVVLNLVTNAREAMPGGGNIRLATSPDPDRPGWVRLEVTDTGPGIPEDVLGRIFDPFFTTKPTGSGLGLAVSYGIVKDHGGVMTVDTREGAGTTFVVAFPGAAVPA